MAQIKVSWDKTIDAAYIRLADAAENGRSVRQVTCGDEFELVRGDIVFDFDREGKIVGIEVLEASALLPPELLAQVE